MAPISLTPLAQVLAEHEGEDLEPVPDQPVVADGEVVNMHCCLTNTIVVGPPILDVGDRRELVRIERVLVDPGALQWQPKPPPWTQAIHAQARARAAAHAAARDRKKAPV